MKKLIIGLVSACLLVTLVFLQPVIIEVSAMTPSSKGKLAIAEMKKMFNITWTSNPSGSVPEIKIYGLKYKALVAYKGMPYTWNADTSYSEFIQSKALVYVPSLYKYFLNQPTSDIGNDCSSAVVFAWKAAGSGVSKSIYTETMYNAARSSQSCMKKRGSYSTKEVIEYYNGNTDYPYKSGTKAFLSSSDYIAAYSALKPGDACFYFYEYYEDGRKKRSGHAILITDVDVAGRKVSYIDQIGGQTRITNNKSTWTSGTMDFYSLYVNYYVPLTTSDVSI